ncbi:hypothetical protein CTZ27_25685 [Streptomyces griseocarneus]|nr:hypothetical protein CTZ27_25685 [Streptomyces griseocarneus]
MGSLRNPIGPLPSSIYWRRRGVALGLLGLLVLLGLWLFVFGGDGGSGGGDQGQQGSSDAKGPADTTITPGPAPSGTHYTQRPGGRGDSGTGGGSGTGDHADTGGGAGSAGGSGGSGSGVLGTGDGRVVPVNSSLPDCTSGSVRLTVRSVKDSYGPDEKPKFEIVVKNSGGRACKVDFGSSAAVLTIAAVNGDDHVWSSGDCPRGRGAVLVELPGSGETKRTLEWDRKRSVPQCGTPAGGSSVGDGTYRVEVKVAGVTEKFEFSLEKG